MLAVGKNLYNNGNNTKANIFENNNNTKLYNIRNACVFLYYFVLFNLLKSVPYFTMSNRKCL